MSYSCDYYATPTAAATRDLTLMDLCLYDDQLPMDYEQLALKPIIKKTSPPLLLKEEKSRSTKKKSVVFKDPICQVRLYDKVAAKRQQWGHATKFSRVKRFCWDNLDEECVVENKDLRRQNRWLPNETDQDYRLMMWKDMQQRRMNRKRRVSGESLAYLVQELEISPNCIEVVASKMRKREEKA